MKTKILIIFILTYSLGFSQSFNDKIITVTGDTISGHIILVNNDNVFYNVNIKNNIDYKSLSLSSVRHIILDKGNHAELLLTGKKDSIIDKTNWTASKVLIVEKTTLQKNQTIPKSTAFTEGERIVIKRYNNKMIVRGKIESISDSSVSVKGNKIKLNEIQRISKRRGGTLLVTGISTLALSGISEAICNNIEQQKNIEDGNGGFSTSLIISIVICSVDLFIIVPIGIIIAATTKHYWMDKDYKLIVK